MRIVSTMAHSSERLRYLVFDTFADDRRYITAIVQAPDGFEKLTELGQQTVSFAAAYHDAQHRKGAQRMPLNAVEVFAESTARKRVLEAFTSISTDQLIVFCGRTDGVCARLMSVLGLRSIGGRA
ncbi:MAG: hypothetical protein K2Q07_10830 [Burkholderiaceae bacterium]|nr:hypothetical protein [Burkholderiaceae bacterium]